MFTIEIERHYKRDITPAEAARRASRFGAAYAVFDELRRQGRDSVWTYVARNLSRPLALAFGTGWANVVVGNPPWVALRHMIADLQKRFSELAKGERVHVGGKFAHAERSFRPVHGARRRASILRAAVGGACAPDAFQQ